MTVLVITDIPRMIDLFERLTRDRGDLVAVSDIHRGVEEMDRLKPAVVIIQNRLSGLSADILLKHLKSRIGSRRCRFVLIGSPENPGVEGAGTFDEIMDPSRSDDELRSVLDAVIRAAASPPGETPERHAEETGAPSGADRFFREFPPESAAAPDTDRQPAAGEAHQPNDGEDIPEYSTYERPRRTKRPVTSDFSRQLDSSSEELAAPEEVVPPPLPGYQRAPFRLRDDLAITDIEETAPWYRRGWVVIPVFTLAVVLAVTFYQSRRSTDVPTARPKEPAAPVTAEAVRPAATSQTARSSASGAAAAFTSHGTGRPRELPAFVPRDGHDKNYAKDHPGWERYQGQAHEYRVFREKNGTIRSIQVLDHSGAGIQESFYITMLKEVAGAAAMRPVSSEIKEGYEIRRGEVGGLQLVQYRDAQGGRLRGVVVIWP